MFRVKIREKHGELTPSFRKLAEFIQNNELDAAFMTATELADQLEVDAATVVRFAQHLGYSGFRELSKEIQEVVRGDLRATYAADLDAATDLGLLRGLLGNERHNVELAQDRLTEEVNSLLPALLGAERIWLFGQGQCLHLAGLWADTLRGVGLPATAVAPDPLTAAKYLKEVGEKHLIIGLSLSPMDIDTANVISLARQRGAVTLGFSASPIAAAALEADTAIICPGPTQTEVSSFTGLAAMIVVLAAAFTVRYPERAEAMKRAVRDTYRELLETQEERSAELDLESLWRQS